MGKASARQSEFKASVIPRRFPNRDGRKMHTVRCAHRRLMGTLRLIYFLLKRPRFGKPGAM